MSVRKITRNLGSFCFQKINIDIEHQFASSYDRKEGNKEIKEWKNLVTVNSSGGSEFVNLGNITFLNFVFFNPSKRTDVQTLRLPDYYVISLKSNLKNIIQTYEGNKKAVLENGALTTELANEYWEIKTKSDYIRFCLRLVIFKEDAAPEFVCQITTNKVPNEVYYINFIDLYRLAGSIPDLSTLIKYGQDASEMIYLTQMYEKMTANKVSTGPIVVGDTKPSYRKETPKSKETNQKEESKVQSIPEGIEAPDDDISALEIPGIHEEKFDFSVDEKEAASMFDDLK